MLFNLLEDELAAKMDAMTHLWHCSAAQLTGWDENETVYYDHGKLAINAYNMVGKALLPWYQWSVKKELSLAEQWKRFKEDEKDPEYAAKLAKFREQLKKENNTVTLAEQAAMLDNAYKERHARLQELAARRARRRDHGR